MNSVNARTQNATTGTPLAANWVHMFDQSPIRIITNALNVNFRMKTVWMLIAYECMSLVLFRSGGLNRR